MLLIGMAADYPPTTEEGFLDFARSLPVSRVFEAISNAQPLSPINGYRRTENVWLHYEQLPAYLEGFVVMGDALCAFTRSTRRGCRWLRPAP
jgi:hypothetical protein